MYEWIDTLDEPERTLFRLARDALTTTSPTTTRFAKKSADFKRVTDALNLPQLSAKEVDARYTKFTAEELAQCDGCDGFCRKSTNRWKIPELFTENGKLRRRYLECKFRAQSTLRRKIRSSQIPTRYLGKTFADYKIDADNREAVDIAKQLLTLDCGAYFYGECGTGKTFLASIIAQDFLKNGKSVIFVKVPSLLDDIKATFNGGNELELLDRLKTANLVVLDDFGMEKSTQWAGSTLCKVLDMRYDNPTARTIITSNLSITELAKHLNDASDGQNLNGSRIADRLNEICLPILFKGLSRRN